MFNINYKKVQILRLLFMIRIRVIILFFYNIQMRLKAQIKNYKTNCEKSLS